MSIRDAVLFANEAFYRAFADGDAKAMEALWARQGPVACVHPGWQAMTSRQEIMETWRRIFANDAKPDVECHAAQAFVQGDTAFVICYEEIGRNVLVATNIFRREGGVWQMVHHHAGPAPSLPPEGPDLDEKLRPN
jgi:ketosteroid isomerase-like protein